MLPVSTHRVIVAILLFASTSANHTLFAQRSKAFEAVGISYSNDSLKNYTKQRLEKDVKSITYDDKYVKNDIKEVYEERTKLVEEIIKSGTIVTDPKINAYYQQILQTIINGNPSIVSDIRLLVVRYDWPNAVCYGNGILLINLGLIERLENESQIAFIIGHELAHQHSDHVNKNITKRALQLNTEETRRKLKAAGKDKAGAKSELLKLVKSTTFDLRKHSRNFELEADSIALSFILNTPYDFQQGARTMDILDSIDQEFFKKYILNFRWFFDSLPIAYKQSWEFYNNETSSLSSIQKTASDSLEEDSLKTHPDCMVRKSALIRQTKHLKPNKGIKKNPQGDNQFRYQLNASFVEVINALYTDSNYASAIYKSMEMAHIYQEDAYPQIIISASLGELHINQRNRTLGKVLPIPRYLKNNPYERVVAFLNELSKTETAALGYWYLRKSVAEIPDNEDYIYAMFITAYAFDKIEEAKKYSELYKSKFAEGKHLAKIKRHKI